MAFDFSVFTDGKLDERYVDWLVKEKSLEMILHSEKLWSYYQNSTRETGAGIGGESPESSRPYCQAQEYGLPGRITGMNYSFYGGVLSGQKLEGINRKEVVIENDIAWRLDAMVDFLFGKRATIGSRAADSERAGEIETLLNAVFEANGGSTYFQQLALLGGVYGFVDVILRWEDMGASGIDWERERDGERAGLAESRPRNFNAALERARKITLEAIEAPRSLPILDESNYRKINYYVQHYWQQHNCLEDRDNGIVQLHHSGRQMGREKETHNVEVLGSNYWQRYEDGELVGEGVNPLGVVPVVHIQNMPLPLRYEGLSDVEPLMPIQDELNTRLSDRASRITFQSFKMYLGKGIEGFENRVVAPGRMWCTENPEACIDEFGGDPGSPSEEAHIDQIREAMDKASGVASVAAGILKGRIGNLTSAVALKLTLMGVLAKTERKRKSYGQGIAELCRLILLALDKTGIYPNQPEERGIEIHWPSPLPENLMEKLQEAKLKKELGVPQEQLLKELGYEAM